MASKTPVTLIQDETGKVIRVRIADSKEFPVMHAGPAVGIGQMNLVIQIENVTIDYAKADTNAA